MAIKKVARNLNKHSEGSQLFGKAISLSKNKYNTLKCTFFFFLLAFQDFLWLFLLLESLLTLANNGSIVLLYSKLNMFIH